MRKAIAAVAVLAATLVVAASAAGAGGRDVIAGGGVTLDSTFGVGATSLPGGLDPQGEVTIRTTIDTDTGPVTGTFHGDVSQGCMSVAGNAGYAIGLLPPDEQYTLTGFGTIQYAGVIVQDNGRQDDAAVVLLKASSAARACAGLFQPFGPLVHGNIVVRDAG